MSKESATAGKEAAPAPRRTSNPGGAGRPLPEAVRSRLEQGFATPLDAMPLPRLARQDIFEVRPEAALDPVAEATLLGALNARVRADDAHAIQARVRTLTTLFRAMPEDVRLALHARLSDPTTGDDLAHAFYTTTHRATRVRLLRELRGDAVPLPTRHDAMTSEGFAARLPRDPVTVTPSLLAVTRFYPEVTAEVRLTSELGPPTDEPDVTAVVRVFDADDSEHGVDRIAWPAANQSSLPAVVQFSQAGTYRVAIDIVQGGLLIARRTRTLTVQKPDTDAGAVAVMTPAQLQEQYHRMGDMLATTEGLTKEDRGNISADRNLVEYNRQPDYDRLPIRDDLVGAGGHPSTAPYRDTQDILTRGARRTMDELEDYLPADSATRRDAETLARHGVDLDDHERAYLRELRESVDQAADAKLTRAERDAAAEAIPSHKGKLTEVEGERAATKYMLSEEPGAELVRGFEVGDGFDQIWVRRGPGGEILEYIIVEAKGPGASLGMTQTKGMQMSDEWVSRTADDLADESQLGRDLQQALMRGKPPVSGRVVEADGAGGYLDRTFDERRGLPDRQPTFAYKVVQR